MIFSRIGRSLSQSSRARNVINGITRETTLLRNQELLWAPYVNNFNNIHQFDGKLGFLRGYLATVGARKGFFSSTHLSDLNYIAANPRLRRYFSSEAPKKKNYENFYPKEKKEIPKQKEQKSESKEEANTNDHSNFRETFMKNLQNIIAPILAIGFILSAFSSTPREEKQGREEALPELLKREELIY